MTPAEHAELALRRGRRNHFTHTRLRTAVRVRSRVAAAVFACALAATGCGSGPASIEWQNLVVVGGRRYVLVTHGDGINATLGSVVGTIRHTLAGHVDNPNYRPRDGDAAYLAPGTTMRAVKGFATWFRVGARHGDQVDVYQLEAQPGTSGAQAFDLQPRRIRALEIRSSLNGSVTRRFVTPALVQRLAAEIESATVHERSLSAPLACFISFAYSDAPPVTLGYTASTGVLEPGITLSHPLRQQLSALGCR